MRPPDKTIFGLFISQNIPPSAFFGVALGMLEFSPVVRGISSIFVSEIESQFIYKTIEHRLHPLNVAQTVLA